MSAPPDQPRRGPLLLLLLGIALVVVVVALLGLRAFQAWEVLHQPPAAQAADTSRIRPWMSVRLIARAHRIPVAELAAQIGAPPSGRVTLLELAQQRNVPVRQVEDECRRAVAELQSTQPAPAQPQPAPRPPPDRAG